MGRDLLGTMATAPEGDSRLLWRENDLLLLVSRYGCFVCECFLDTDVCLFSFSIHFSGFLGYWIMYPVLLGIAFEVMALYFNDFNRPELPAFAFFIAIWTVTMVRYWQRVQVQQYV